MPYIEQERRDRLDPYIHELAKAIQLSNIGELNYSITSLLRLWIKRNGGPTYTRLNALLGVLNAVTQEFYRKAVAPYEETKIEQNGDIEWPKSQT